jgi:hypothetical protein
MITQATSHRRSDPQGLMDSGEVVVYGVDRNHSRVILNFLAERIGQSRKAPHAHSHAQVVPFYVGRAYVLGVGVAANGLHLAADADCWRIAARLFIGWCAVNLLQLRVVYVRAKSPRVLKRLDLNVFLLLIYCQPAGRSTVAESLPWVVQLDSANVCSRVRSDEDRAADSCRPQSGAGAGVRFKSYPPINLQR